MKKLKLIVYLFAFVIASGAAFASGKVTLANLFADTPTDCIQCPKLDQDACTATSGIQCRVTCSGTNYLAYWQDNGILCAEPAFRVNPLP